MGIHKPPKGFKGWDTQAITTIQIALLQEAQDVTKQQADFHFKGACGTYLMTWSYEKIWCV